MSSHSNELTSHDIAVLDSLHAASKGISQRELARETGLSLGLINAVIKKLVRTGYVKTSHLNRRQLDYLLTPEGFAHTAQRSYHYVLNTVRSYREIREHLKVMIENFLGSGVSELYINGSGELAELAIVIFAEDGRIAHRRGLPAVEVQDAVVVNAAPDYIDREKFRVVELAMEIKNARRNSAHVEP